MASLPCTPPPEAPRPYSTKPNTRLHSVSMGETPIEVILSPEPTIKG